MQRSASPRPFAATIRRIPHTMPRDTGAQRTPASSSRRGHARRMRCLATAGRSPVVCGYRHVGNGCLPTPCAHQRSRRNQSHLLILALQACRVGGVRRMYARRRRTRRARPTASSSPPCGTGNEGILGGRVAVRFFEARPESETNLRGNPPTLFGRHRKRETPGRHRLYTNVDVAPRPQRRPGRGAGPGLSDDGQRHGVGPRPCEVGGLEE